MPTCTLMAVNSREWSVQCVDLAQVQIDYWLPMWKVKLDITQDYSWDRSSSLPLPSSPHTLHNLYAVKMLNLAAVQLKKLALVALYDWPVCIGPCFYWDPHKVYVPQGIHNRQQQLSKRKQLSRLHCYVESLSQIVVSEGSILSPQRIPLHQQVALRRTQAPGTPPGPISSIFMQSLIFCPNNTLPQPPSCWNPSPLENSISVTGVVY